jgi:hypothetical protein
MITPLNQSTFISPHLSPHLPHILPHVSPHLNVGFVGLHQCGRVAICLERRGAERHDLLGPGRGGGGVVGGAIGWRGGAWQGGGVDITGGWRRRQRRGEADDGHGWGLGLGGLREALVHGVVEAGGHVLLVL